MSLSDIDRFFNQLWPEDPCYECGKGAPGWIVEPNPEDGEPMQVQCQMCAERSELKMAIEQAERHEES